MGFSPCQEHVWVRGDPLPEPLRSIWQDELQGCRDHHHHLVVPDMGLSLWDFTPLDGRGWDTGVQGSRSWLLSGWDERLWAGHISGGAADLLCNPNQ